MLEHQHHLLPPMPMKKSMARRIHGRVLISALVLVEANNLKAMTVLSKKLMMTPTIVAKTAAPEMTMAQGMTNLNSRHYRGEVDDTWKRWGSESRNSDASWSFASDTVDKARHDNTGHRRQVTRDASSVGMGSDDEDQMVSSDDSVRGWDDNNQGNQNATIVPAVKPHVPTNR